MAPVSQTESSGSVLNVIQDKAFGETTWPFDEDMNDRSARGVMVWKYWTFAQVCRSIPRLVTFWMQKITRKGFRRSVLNVIQDKAVGETAWFFDDAEYDRRAPGVMAWKYTVFIKVCRSVPRMLFFLCRKSPRCWCFMLPVKTWVFFSCNDCTALLSYRYFSDIAHGSDCSYSGFESGVIFFSITDDHGGES